MPYKEIEPLISELKKIKGVVIKEPMVLASGQRADYYIDIKKAYGYPKVLNLMADLLSSRLPYYISCIASSGYGGVPLASLMAAKTDLHLCLIRETPKNHGTKSLIDGYIPQQRDIVALVDDVFTTGGSLKKMDAVLDESIYIEGYYVVVKRGDGQMDKPLHYLISAEDLINV